MAKLPGGPPQSPSLGDSSLIVYLEGDFLDGTHSDGEVIDDILSQDPADRLFDTPTGGREPTYETNEINGHPVMRFTGDRLQDDDADFLGPLTGPVIEIVVLHDTGRNQSTKYLLGDAIAGAGGRHDVISTDPQYGFFVGSLLNWGIHYDLRKEFVILRIEWAASTTIHINDVVHPDSPIATGAPTYDEQMLGGAGAATSSFLGDVDFAAYVLLDNPSAAYKDEWTTYLAAKYGLTMGVRPTPDGLGHLMTGGVSGSGGEIRRRPYNEGFPGPSTVDFDHETTDDMHGVNGRDGFLYYSLVRATWEGYKVDRDDGTKTTLGRTSPGFSEIMSADGASGRIIIALQNHQDLIVGNIDDDDDDTTFVDTGTSWQCACFNEAGTLIYHLSPDEVLSTYDMDGVFIEELWDVTDVDWALPSCIRVDTVNGFLFGRSSAFMMRFDLADGGNIKKVVMSSPGNERLFSLDRARQKVITYASATQISELPYDLADTGVIIMNEADQQADFCAVVTG